ncbi:MAG TPA: hypothetical protein VH643_07695 [Gemmataceae bacterium]
MNCALWTPQSGPAAGDGKDATNAATPAFVAGVAASWGSKRDSGATCACGDGEVGPHN